MFDEMERLSESGELFELLSHYAALGARDRQAWQDRRMELEGAGPSELVKLHGELIAYGWLEQNTGVLPAVRAGAVPGCYRISTAGVRALKQAREEAA